MRMDNHIEYHYRMDVMSSLTSKRKESLAWYIKWCASVLFITSMAARATGLEAFSLFDLYLSTVGVFGWLLVGILWNDRALIILNSVGFIILLIGVFKSLVS